MNSILAITRKVTLFFLGALMGLNVITMCAGVVSRFFMNISLGWTDELGAVSLVWITFLGAAFATIDGKHMSMDGVVKKFGLKTRQIITLIVNILMLVFMYLMVVFGFRQVGIVFNDSLTSMPISRGIVVSVIPISGVIMFIFMAVRIVNTIKILFTGSKEDQMQSGGEEL